MNKKGFVGDVGFVIVYLFLMAIVLVTAFMVYSKFNDSWQGNADIDAQSKTIASNVETKFKNSWDFLFATLILGLFIGIVLLAFLIRTHPAFAMVGFLFIIIFGGVSVYLANAFYEFASDSTISTYANEFTLIPFIMNNYPYIVIPLGFIFIIILFSKNNEGGII